MTCKGSNSCSGNCQTLNFNSAQCYLSNNAYTLPIQSKSLNIECDGSVNNNNNNNNNQGGGSSNNTDDNNGAEASSLGAAAAAGLFGVGVMIHDL